MFAVSSSSRARSEQSTSSSSEEVQARVAVAAWGDGAVPVLSICLKVDRLAGSRRSRESKARSVLTRAVLCLRRFYRGLATGLRLGHDSPQAVSSCGDSFSDSCSNSWSDGVPSMASDVRPGAPAGRKVSRRSCGVTIACGARW